MATSIPPDFRQSAHRNLAGFDDGWRPLIIPLYLLAVAITGICFYAYSTARTAMTQSIAADLEAIAGLKRVQVEHWLAHKHQNLDLISNAQLSIDLQQWLTGGADNPLLKRRLLAQLGAALDDETRSVSLLSPDDGRLLLTAGEHRDSSAIREQTLRSARQGISVIEDISMPAENNDPVMAIGFFKPVHSTDGGQLLAVIHLNVDPSQELFPLLRDWPGASRTAETQLLRREGDDVLFLNAQRQRGDATRQVRLPLATTNLLAAKLLSDDEHFLNADDYRGTAVMAYGLPVAGTAWFIVTKIDRAEAYERFDMVATITAGLFGALLLVCSWWLLARRRSEMAQQANFAEIEDLYQNAPCGYHSLDRNGVIVRINDTELGMLGYSRTEVLGRMSFQELLTPASLQQFLRQFPRFMETGEVRDLEFDLIRKDGTHMPVLVNSIAIKDGKGNYVMSRSTVVDITQHKLAEQAQKRLERALGLIEECNMALLQNLDELALFDTICRLVVDKGGYRMAWVGIPGSDADKTVHVVSRHGDESGYLDQARFSWADTPLGRGPSGTAIRLAKAQVNQDFLGNPTLAPWREAAIRCGYQASIALPLIGQDGVSGMLAIYSAEPNAFGEDEVELLKELADNLAFGIHSLRLGCAHNRLKNSLSMTRNHLEGLFNSIRDAILILPLRADGSPGNFVEVNDEACRYLGYQRAELLAMSPLDLEPPEFHASMPMLSERVRQERSIIFERVHLAKDGRRIPVEISASVFKQNGETMVVSLVRDITERKLASQQLIDSANELHRLSANLESVREEERTHLARELHDELGQMLTALKMDLALLGKAIPARIKEAPPILGNMSAMIDEILGAVRRIAADLRPMMLDELGLKAALEWLAEDFTKRYQHIKCNLVIALEDHLINGKAGIAAYRIVQECLTNIVRHAQADKVHIAVGIDQQHRLFITVHDNGRGAQEQDFRKNGFGLVGMRERVHALGGQFSFESTPGKGCSIDVTIPLPRYAAEGKTQ
ncbi:MAG: PAS domain S-box protein [Dechloromonas sp.]|nr:MAG: PAS domain S-box protein [Dechloromonas sp.]